jgi:hypothetical protein
MKAGEAAGPGQQFFSGHLAAERRGEVQTLMVVAELITAAVLQRGAESGSRCERSEREKGREAVQLSLEVQPPLGCSSA